MPRAKSNKPMALSQIKICLSEGKPAIWRRVVIPAELPLDWLHVVIQIVMGWQNSHLHQFITGTGPNSTYYKMANDDESGGPCEEDYTVKDLAPRARSKFGYEYDFGDSWHHEIVIEKSLPPDPEFKHPVCLAGEGAGPPEDCGGMYGYCQLLETLNDPTDPEYREVLDNYGPDGGAVAFDLKAVNKQLKTLKF